MTKTSIWVQETWRLAKIRMKRKVNSPTTGPLSSDPVASLLGKLPNVDTSELPKFNVDLDTPLLELLSGTSSSFEPQAPI